MNTLIRCTFVVQEDAVDRLTGLLALHVPFGWEEASLSTGETRFCIHCAHREFMDTLAVHVMTAVPEAFLCMEEVAEHDWSLAWREYFTPIACGTRFMVLPPWLRDSADIQGRIPIVIEPKSAFGTGHHATTALCLAVLSDLLEAGRVHAGMRFLDLGTGSGILGIGCCLAGLTGMGIDIDMLAVENALENRKLNRTEGFTVLHGSLERVGDESFDLVLANILARPLQEMAPELTRRVRPGGCLVLSGLLVVQADAVEVAYRNQGLPAARRVDEGEWMSLVWELGGE